MVYFRSVCILGERVFSHNSLNEEAIFGFLESKVRITCGTADLALVSPLFMTVCHDKGTDVNF